MSAHDLSSNQVTATGTVIGRASRLWVLVIATGATAGSVVLRDGGAAGEVKATLNFPAGVGTVVIDLPQPMRFETDIHATVAVVTHVTAFYE